MKSNGKPKLSFSVSDFPLLVSTSEIFAFAKDLKVDGIEIMIGYKTRLSLSRLEKLSSDYNVPILSIHQPPWGWFGYFYDEFPLKAAHHFNALYVSHPVFVHSLFSKQSKELFLWLSRMKDKYSVEVLIENMPKDFSHTFLKHIIPIDPSSSSLNALKTIYETYHFGMAFDTAHFEVSAPHKEKEFQDIEKYIKNIHLSDFSHLKHHLTLGKGTMDAKGFIAYLKDKKYEGVITVELTDKLFSSQKKYFEGVKASIEKIREYLV